MGRPRDLIGFHIGRLGMKCSNRSRYVVSDGDSRSCRGGQDGHDGGGGQDGLRSKRRGVGVWARQGVKQANDGFCCSHARMLSYSDTSLRYHYDTMHDH